MEEQTFAIVNRHSRAEEPRKNTIVAASSNGKGHPAIPPRRRADGSEKLKANRDGHGEVKPGVMPGYVAIRDDPAEILHPDRGPPPTPPNMLARAQGSYQSQGQPARKKLIPTSAQTVIAPMAPRVI